MPRSTAGRPSTLAMVVVLAGVAVAACGGTATAPSGTTTARATGGSDPAVDSTPRPVSTAASSPERTPRDAGAGVSCAGRAIAPVLDPSAIVGSWLYLNAILYEDGRDYDARVTGTLALGPDRRWNGTREIITGGRYQAVAYGPGGWTFDGRTLTLAYDDGSDAETYTGVHVGTHRFEDREGRSLILEVADATSCMVYTLVEARP
jgi:hypothetical protein